MNTIRNILSFAALLVALIAVPVFAQSPDPAPPVLNSTPADPDKAAVVAPALNAGLIDSVLAVVAEALVGKYGWAAKLFAVLGTIAGTLRLVVKPIWAKFVLPGLEQYVASTPDPGDDAKLHAFLEKRWVRAALFAIDLVASVKIPVPKKAA